MVTLLAASLAALNAVMAFVLYRVGAAVLERRPAGQGRLAAISFALWWFTLAALQLGGILDFAIQAAGYHWTFAAYSTYIQIVLLLLVAAVGGLLYYMIFVYTGRHEAWKVIAATYGVLYALIVYFIALQEPIGLVEGARGTEFAYRYDLSDTLLARSIGVLLLLPTILAAIGYLSLYPRVEEKSQKFRIGAVGGSFMIWFGSSLVVGQFTSWGDTTAWRLTSAAITLASAIAVYMAFQPPAWLRRRFGLVGFGERP